MNIQEAMKSGKPFKRKGHKVYIQGGIASVDSFFSYEEVLATDWEVEEEKISLSASDIRKVLMNFPVQYSAQGNLATGQFLAIDTVLKHLGFKS